MKKKTRIRIAITRLVKRLQIFFAIWIQTNSIKIPFETISMATIITTTIIRHSSLTDGSNLKAIRIRMGKNICCTQICMSNAIMRIHLSACLWSSPAQSHQFNVLHQTAIELPDYKLNAPTSVPLACNTKKYVSATAVGTHKKNACFELKPREMNDQNCRRIRNPNCRLIHIRAQTSFEWPTRDFR